MDLFLPVRFKTSVQLPAADLAELGVAFEKTLLDKVKATHETICTRFGYIRRGSLRIVKRSAGNFMKQHFNGYTKFELLCRAEVCNPAKGSVYEAVVRNKNALGVHAEAMSDGVAVLDIIIPKRAAGIQSEIALDELQSGDEIYVKVLGKKYQLNDRFISIIGCAVKKPGGAAAAAAEAAALGALTEGEFGEAEGAEGELVGGGTELEESESGDGEADGDGEGDSDAEDDASRAGSVAAGSEFGEDDAPAVGGAGAILDDFREIRVALGDAAAARAEGEPVSEEENADDDYDGGYEDDDADDDPDGSDAGGSDEGGFFRD